MNFIDSLIKNGWLKTPEIIAAFRKIKRTDFVPEDMKDLAALNEALPIGGGQTISQPLVVAFMLEHLQPQSGEKILDIGTGSGWTTALLAEIVGEKGKVFAIEIIPDLKEFGERNVHKYDFIEKGIVEFTLGDGSKGYPDMSSRPELVKGFDKILCSASVQTEVPKAWKEQLKVNGIIVTPIGSSIWILIKKTSSSAKPARPIGEATEDKEENFKEVEYPGFAFVPLIDKPE